MQIREYSKFLKKIIDTKLIFGYGWGFEKNFKFIVSGHTEKHMKILLFQQRAASAAG